MEPALNKADTPTILPPWVDVSMRCSGYPTGYGRYQYNYIRSEINSCLLVWNINFLLTLLIGVTMISLPLLIADMPPRRSSLPLLPQSLHTDDGISECTRCKVNHISCYGGISLQVVQIQVMVSMKMTVVKCPGITSIWMVSCCVTVKTLSFIIISLF